VYRPMQYAHSMVFLGVFVSVMTVESCKNSWNSLDSVWDMDSFNPKEPYIFDLGTYWCHLTNTTNDRCSVAKLAIATITLAT